MENIVLMEVLSRGYQVSVGKVDGREIDFLLRKANEVLYLQVTYLLADQSTIGRDFGVYSLIQDHYRKYAISMDKVDFSRDGIVHINVVDFLEMASW